MDDEIRENLKLNTQGAILSDLNVVGLALSDLTIKNSIFASQLVNLSEKVCGSSMSLAIDNQISAFNEINLSDLNLPKINERASSVFSAAREATISLSELASSDNIFKIGKLSTDITPWFGEVMASSRKTADYIQPVIKASELFLDNVNKLIEPNKLAQFSIQSNLAKISELSIFAENSLSRIGGTELGAAINLDEASKLKISDSFLGLSAGYKNLFSSFEGNLKTFANFDPHIARLTSEEYFNSANLLESISVEEDEEVTEQILKNDILIDNEKGLSFYLPQIDSDLINLWNGSKEAFRSDNPDRVRHFSVSLRELFTKVIHSLAPDHKIKLWTSHKDYFHDGNPTRRARLNYICRNINNGKLEEFVEKDIVELLSFLDLFQDCTHEIKSGITENQLVAMQCRAESAIKYLIIVGKS